MSDRYAGKGEENDRNFRTTALRSRRSRFDTPSNELDQFIADQHLPKDRSHSLPKTLHGGGAVRRSERSQNFVRKNSREALNFAENPRSPVMNDSFGASEPGKWKKASTSPKNDLEGYFSDREDRADSLPFHNGLKPSPSTMSSPMDSERDARTHKLANGYLEDRNEDELRRSGRYRKSTGFKRSGSIRSIKKFMNRLVHPGKSDKKSSGYDTETRNERDRFSNNDFPDSRQNSLSRHGYSPGSKKNGSRSQNGYESGHGHDSGLDTPSESASLNPINAGASAAGLASGERHSPPAGRVDIPIPSIGGIVNHGNTCYMNSVIQCLSNTDRLAEYFVTGQYQESLEQQDQSQIKNSQTFGTDGVLTHYLADFLKALWLNSYETQLSKNLKALIGRFSPDYRSGRQQDAQEFLMWLLDKVHEDLNTGNKPKSYKTRKSVSGYNSEDEMAGMVLKEHRRSHQSFISYLFEAQFRSSVTCPQCKKVKLNFDPYMCIQLQVPQSTTKPLFVTVVFLNRAPRQLCFGLNADVTATIKEVKDCLAHETKIPDNQLVLCEISETGVQALLAETIDIATLGSGKMIHALETPPPASPGSPDSSHETTLLLSLSVETTPGSHLRFGGPYTLRLNRDVSANCLTSRILSTISQQIRKEFYYDDIPSNAYRLRVVDDYMASHYIDSHVAMPLYTQDIERVLNLAYSMKGRGSVTLQLVMEWKRDARMKFLVEEEEPVLEHYSARDLKLEILSPQSSLYDCLREYTKNEYLEWTCRNCRRYQPQAEKSLRFWSLPDILIVHLKRFKQLANGQQVKLDPVIDFPLDGLDLSDFAVKQASAGMRRYAPSRNSGRKKSPFWGRKQRDAFINDYQDNSDEPPMAGENDLGKHVYDLFGVVNHLGESLNSGHYTSFAKNPLDGAWRSFDDTNVQPIHQAQIVNSSAYLLFYEKRVSNRPRSSRSNSNYAESGFGEHWIYRIAAAEMRKKANGVKEAPRTEGMDGSGNSPSDSARRHEAPSTSPKHRSPQDSRPPPPQTTHRASNGQSPAQWRNSRHNDSGSPLDLRVPLPGMADRRSKTSSFPPPVPPHHQPSKPNHRYAQDLRSRGVPAGDQSGSNRRSVRSQVLDYEKPLNPRSSPGSPVSSKGGFSFEQPARPASAQDFHSPNSHARYTQSIKTGSAIETDL